LGGFYASIDADSEGGEGAFYTWSPAEIANALPDTREMEIFTATYAQPVDGNFDGWIILQRMRQPEKTAADLGMELSEYLARLKLIHAKLRSARDLRPRPATDDKILLAWNGLTICAFAQAGRYFGRTDYLRAAQQCARFILSGMSGQNSLFRSWREGRASIPAFLEDYAALILALLTLYQADGDHAWYQASVKLTDEMLEKFKDPAGGFFDTSVLATNLVYRPKDLQDNATPSGNSLAIRSLLILSALTGEHNYLELADISLKSIQETLSQYPTAFGSWLLALDHALNPYQQLAIVWEDNSQDDALAALLSIPLKTYKPRLIFARSPLPLQPEAPALLLDRPTIDHAPTAYYCQEFVCQLPVTDPEALRHQLG